MRAISMMWIILGHTGNFQLPGFIGFDNISAYFDLLRTFAFQGDLSANFCVDTFFFLSGLLMTYVLIRKHAKEKKNSPFLLVCLLRYLRLVPLYGFIIGVYAYLAGHFSSGPFWYRMIKEYSQCRTWGWTNLLFINNFVPSTYSDQCVPWTWYLANDMQFFVFGLFIFNFIYSRFRRLGTATVIICIVIPIIMEFQITYSKDLTLTQGDSQNTIYDKPYTRGSPFFIGMLVAIIYADILKLQSPFQSGGVFFDFGVNLDLLFGLRKSEFENLTINMDSGESEEALLKNIPIYSDTAHANGSEGHDSHPSEKKEDRVVLLPILVMCFAVFGLLSISYVSYDFWIDVEKHPAGHWSNAGNAAYNAFSRSGYAICLGILTLLCICKDGGVVNYLLTLPFWEPLGKLTFAAYLIHPILMRITYYSLTDTVHFDCTFYVFDCVWGVIIE